MPRRNIPEHADDALDLTTTSPLFLVHIDFTEARQVRMTTFDDDNIWAEDQWWWPTDLKVVGPSQKAGVNLQATITVPYNALVGDVIEGGSPWTDTLNNVLWGGAGVKRPQDRPAKLYQTFYYKGAYLTPTLMLDGVIGAVNISSSPTGNSVPTISMVLKSRGVRGGLTPNIRVGPPLMNRVTPPGSTLLFDNTRIRVD